MTTPTLQKKQQIHEDNDVSTTTSSKPKERRIVTWTQEEDDILREQISIHGTENWTIIASKFKDKTTRQCRRRWYTYLNSDFKKGGWSPEEDMLLCEAQKIFGNRWTEIAKVVSGRTDNAVKNRFSTLCKKKAKREALAKENTNAYINVNNKRILIDSNGFHSQAIASPLKKFRREHIPNPAVSLRSGNMLLKECVSSRQHPRPPFAVLAQNVDKSLVSATKDSLINVTGDKKLDGTFLRKDDPKVAALVQQAELLSSLAVKVNMDNTEQSLENAWKVLQNFFGKSKENEEFKYKIADTDMQLDDFKALVESLRSSSDDIPLSQRQHDVYESPSSSEYSTGSTNLSACDQGELSQGEISTMHEDIRAASQSVQIADDGCVDMPENKFLSCATADQDFNSPLQVTPLFRTLASTIPSPQFSESERHFLLRTLGIESPTQNTITNSMQPPPCRKALLQGL
ncbi:transcription factor MYB124 isoform X1 [Spinacia oleracea]|uniref:Transcription factor MYB124 isoform X1 n=1 Tax=Spinacia oleracea TaxID=3562 RepID=A0A9R0I8T7_SPIOL|nr:transcription factor MYB124 isoform X1 [Spinacia oleracea]